MSDWRRVELPEESELGTFAVRRAWATLVLGAGSWLVAALGVAAGVVWLAMPAGVLTLLAAPFLALGTGWLTVGIKTCVWDARRRWRLARSPGTPWMADHAWRPPVVRDGAGTELVALLARLVMGVACGAPVAVGLWLIEEESSAVLLGGLTLVAAAIGVVYVGRRTLRWLCQGTSRLVLTTFPVAPGQALQATFRPGRYVPVRGGLRLTLRFVAEEHELGGGFSRVADADVVCYRLYADRCDLSVPGGGLDPSTGLSFSIPVPAEALARGYLNALSGRPARYWQLLVEARTPGSRLRSVFFVPVYRPITNG